MIATPKKFKKGWSGEDKWGVFVNNDVFLGNMISDDTNLFKYKEFNTFREAELFIENHSKLELAY